MVSPVRKGQAVDQVQRELGVSERRACQVLGQSRWTQRYKPRLPEKAAPLVEQLHRLSPKHPRHGYRMVRWLRRHEGWEANSKRVRRLWREEGLKGPRKSSKKRRLGSSEKGIQRQKATRINQVWS